MRASISVIAFLLVAAVLPVTSPLRAQSAADVRYARSIGSDRYMMYLGVTCDGSPYYDLQREQIGIVQDRDTVESGNLLIETRPSADKNLCFDVGLVFDNSGTMLGPAFTAALDAGKAFVDSMLGPCQSAAIVAFSNTPTVHEFLTSDHDVLKTAIDRMSASGNAAIYDGVRTAMLTITERGTEPFRAIFVLTNGGDNASLTTLNTLILDAQAEFYRVFVIGIGAGVDTLSLRRLARETGGLYYPIDDPAHLPEVCAHLAAYTRRGFDEYVIRYQARGIYPQPREVTATVDACGGKSDDTFQFSYQPVTGVGEPDPAPATSTLEQNYPNPVPRNGASRTTIAFTQARSGRVSLTLFDALGRRIAVLFDADATAGRHRVTFDADTLPPGTYFYQLRAGGSVLSRILTVLR